MVGSQQKYFRYKALINIVLLLLISSCTNDEAYTIIELHFKPVENLIGVVRSISSSSDDIQYMDNKIIIPSNHPDLTTLIKIIEVVDTPPVTYKLDLTPRQSGKVYSTSKQPRFIYILEGKKTSLTLNNHKLEININRASEHTSIADYKIIRMAQLKEKGSWLLSHGEIHQDNSMTFPKGLKLTVESRTP